MGGLGAGPLILGIFFDRRRGEGSVRIGWKMGTAATLPGSMVSWRSTGGIVALLLDHRLMAIIPPGCPDGRSRRLRKL